MYNIAKNINNKINFSVLHPQVQKFTILEKDFSVPGGELGKNNVSFLYIEVVSVLLDTGIL